MDHVIVVFVDCFERTKVYFDIISCGAMEASMALTIPCMRALVGSYAVYCARIAMVLKHTLENTVQRNLDSYRRYQKKHTGVAWPFPVCIHPVMKISANDVFVMTALEFLPA